MFDETDSTLWKNNPHETPLEDELRQERDRYMDLAGRRLEELTELRRQLKALRRYNDELESQLEYSNPGVVKEVREFLEESVGPRKQAGADKL